MYTQKKKEKESDRKTQKLTDAGKKIKNEQESVKESSQDEQSSEPGQICPTFGVNPVVTNQVSDCNPVVTNQGSDCHPVVTNQGSDCNPVVTNQVSDCNPVVTNTSYLFNVDTAIDLNTSTSTDIFVHQSVIEGEGWRSLKPGEKVDFKLR